MGVTLFAQDGSLQSNSLKTYGRDNVILVPGVFAYDAVYAAGGEAIDDWLDESFFPVNGKPEGVLIQNVAGYNFVYNKATGKILAYVTNTGVEVADGVDLTALSLQFLAWGR